MRFAAALAFVAVLLTPRAGGAFYSKYGDDYQVDLTSIVRINDTLGRFPQIGGLPFEIDRGLNIAGALGRVMGTVIVGEHLSFEAHVFGLASGQAVSPLLAGTTTADGFGASDQGRWAGLVYRPYLRGGTVTEIAADRLNFRLNVGPLELTVGRQPINLSATSFFVPNDFWQAFSAQTFFRVYKPGVDAVRAEIELGALTRLSLIGALGFERTGEGAVDDPISTEDSSGIARFSTVFSDFEFAVLGGAAPQRWVVGGAVQGELFAGIGLRGEGHWAIPHDDAQDPRAEIAVGLERRFESSLVLSAEYFFHGAGATDPDDYLARSTDPVFSAGPPYFGRHYVAAAATYELTPLTNGSALLLANLADGSFLASVYVVRSLDDEAEASLVVSVPVGSAPTIAGPTSELGAAPLTVGLEVRRYF